MGAIISTVVDNVNDWWATLQWQRLIAECAYKEDSQQCERHAAAGAPCLAPARARSRYEEWNANELWNQFRNDAKKQTSESIIATSDDLLYRRMSRKNCAARVRSSDDTAASTF